MSVQVHKRSVEIHKRSVRDALMKDTDKHRAEPYWAAPLERGRFIGFRVIDAKRGSWIARARDPETGKQKYQALKDVKDHNDYDAVRKAAREWFANLDAGVTTPTSGPFTVEHACKEYVDNRRKNPKRGDKTADDAEWRFKKYVYGKPFGRTKVTKLRSPAIEEWREGLGMTPAGANRMLTSLRAALNLAVHNDRVPATAATAWRKVKQYEDADGRREIFLDLAQRRALLDAVGTDSVRDLIEAALLTGARPGELVSATRDAFDARNKTLKLIGKTGRRDVPLSKAAFALFERLAKSKLPSAPLLTRDDGEPWTRIEWSRRINAAAAVAVVKDADGQDAKLPEGVCLYTCRHTYISQALHDGLTTLDVSTQTGTSLKMIQEHYGHVRTDAVRERMDKVQML